MGEGSCANREREPAAGGVYRPRNPRASPLWQCARRHGAELRDSGRLRRALEAQVIERFIECGDPHHGFARIYCDACGHDYLLAYSCKTRYFCPSCHQKRVLLCGEWVEENVLEPVAHRQYVFTVPRLLRPIFGRHRAWLGELCRIAARLLVEAYAEAAPGARPELILFVQTFGDLANFNPHVHVLAADGAFRPDGTFVLLPAVPEGLLVETGTVIYRSKMHLGLKRNFQVMPGAEWLELLCRHIPDRYEHLVRDVGWYSNRARGERAKFLKDPESAATPAAPVEPASEFPARARAAWARLIRKVYEADPLVCSKCKGPMRVIALIDDPGVIRRVLEHLGRWAPEAPERGPPAQALDWPQNAVIALTYHPVPDIA